MENINKSFPGVQALKDVSFELNAGEIHSICGENGAGKSTLIKILCGIHGMDTGTVSINGEPVHIQNVQDARALGIAYIPQETQICPDLTVAENVFMDKIPRNGLGIVQWKKLFQKAMEVQGTLGKCAERIDVRSYAGDLTIGQRQLIEIIRALTFDAKIIALDEPTSSLSKGEIKELFELLNKLKVTGIGIIYVSHKLNEIMELCDRVTVFKDGQRAGTQLVRETNVQTLINLMVGRSIDLYGAKKEKIQGGQEFLRVEKLTSEGKIRDISFSVHGGEILGMFGIVGAGRTETSNAIFGLDSEAAGDIYVHGKKVKINSPQNAVKLGIGYVTEDRRGQGLVLCNTVRSNVSMTILKKLTKLFCMDLQQEKKISEHSIRQLNIKVTNDRVMAENLSGGNQQKVVISKWLCTNSDILIFDEPTRGIDIGAKSEIYRIMKELALGGKAIIVISSELPELLGVSDRIVVFRNGQITANLDNTDLQEQDLLQYAINY